MSSIVGVGAVFNEVADDGWITVLRFIGVISLALGIFNLIPILPLDGGHILFALLEKVKGSAFSAVTYGRASFVGLAIVMLIFVFALQNDIGRITGEGFQINRVTRKGPAGAPGRRRPSRGGYSSQAWTMVWSVMRPEASRSAMVAHSTRVPSG